MPEFNIRSAQPGDVAGIAALQDDVEPDVRMAPEPYCALWHWLCEANPVGIREAYVGADAEGRIVAHEALVPFTIRNHDTTLIGGLPCQLVVQREFRRTALFPKLELQLLAEYPRSGVHFAYAPARERVLKAHVALGFRELGRLPVYARPYRLGNLARHYLGAGWLYRLLAPAVKLAELPLRFRLPHRSLGVKVAPIAAYDDATGDALDAVCARLGACALRTARILNWRFFQAPDRHYQAFVARDASAILGHVVLRRMSMHGFDTLALVDLVFSPERPEVGRSLLAMAHRAALTAGVEMAVCMLNPHSPLLPALRRYGFMEAPESFTLIVHEPPQSSVGLDDEFYRRWHLTWFDHDYV
jgi:hypothetical protein